MRRREKEPLQMKRKRTPVAADRLYRRYEHLLDVKNSDAAMRVMVYISLISEFRDRG